jgi:sulfite reductase (ferredoxin)
MTVPTWKERLAERMGDDLAREIDIYETQLELKRQGKIEDKLFAETRLRRGVYGQRYDNGQRHDGIAHRRLEFPTGDLTKGPETLWDAPGMQRIKIPFGGLNPEQMDVLADLAEEYSDAICHVTTRQDIQLHFVQIDDTPDLMRRLAAVGITTREACGNSVRNVTACPIAGVCHGETFDVTPYAKACAQFLLGHPDVQDFGRKFKVAFSGCKHNACGLTTMHDLGFIARTQVENGQERRGFEMFVGGGLGAVPHEAKLFDGFVPEDEILPLAQAISRVFARLGEKRNRGRARIKFLVEKLGIERFRELVLEERQTLPHDPAWTGYLQALPAYGETPLKPGQPSSEDNADPDFAAWRKTNVYAQKQPGYAVATVTLPLGDITSWQMRQLADIARRYVGDNIRTTVEQNIVLRWVAEADLPALYRDLKAVGLGKPGAGTLLDVTACPGTDTCKLGIASSRGLAAELSERLAAKASTLDEAVQGLRIKLSGCFNA